jgi:outer membrane protein assembly factor BamE (lipoprotein component of BamABCDE complex)
MKKFIIACLAAAALVSLSACSTVNDDEAVIPSTTNSPRSLVPFPDTVIGTTDTALPHRSGAP